MEYLLTDMGGISYLIRKGFRHTELRPTGRNGQLAFVFTDPTARTEVGDYFCGATVPARNYFDATRAAKALLYEEKDICRKDHAEYVPAVRNEHRSGTLCDGAGMASRRWVVRVGGRCLLCKVSRGRHHTQGCVR
jgi:hypothetical protein